MPIVTNEKARLDFINSEVDRAVSECQASADKGRGSIYFTTSRDIQREVRDILEEKHNIYVPMMIYCGVNSRPSHLQIDHFGDKSEMKLKWR